MSEFVKLTFGSTDGSVRPASLQEVGRPSSMTMQGLSPNVQYYSQAELYDGLQLVSQSLQETFRTLSAGVITLTHVSDVRSGNNYIITYSVSSTYALSSSIMSINSTNVQGQISGNTISFVVGSLTMGQTYSYSISTIDIYGETDATSGSLVTVAQNYINIAYSSRTSSSVTFDLDYVSDGGFYEGYIEYWSSEKDPSTDQADGHTFFQDGADTVTQSNLDEGTTYKFRATILQSVGGTEIHSSVVTQSTADIDYSGDYLTITSTSANNQVKLKSNTSWSSATIDFSTDGGSTWTSVAASSSGNGNAVATLNNGDKLIMRHTGSIGSGNTQIYCSGSYTVSGNLASLQFGDNFDVSGQTAQEFGSLFKQTPVTSAKGLYLGAYSTMSAYSFRYMFQNCTSLTKAPSTLPATTLANNCYQGMFNGCTALTSAPSISATSVPSSAFSDMFQNCNRLTTAPSFTISTLSGNTACKNMFKGCTALTNVSNINLTASTATTDCYHSMFQNCTSLITTPNIAVTTCSIGTFGFTFDGCTSLVDATSIRISATSAPEWCCYSMFQSCRNLTKVNPIPFTTLDGYATEYMFKDCTALTKAPAFTVTTLNGNYACTSMFQGCTSLTDISDINLDAATVKDYCYQAMFRACTALTTAPELKQATTVGINGMWQMYYNCTNLSTVYAPTVSTWETTKMSDWLYGVAASGTLYADSSIAESIPTSSTSGCPSGWSVVEN